jgi:hypothetical protein
MAVEPHRCITIHWSGSDPNVKAGDPERNHEKHEKHEKRWETDGIIDAMRPAQQLSLSWDFVFFVVAFSHPYPAFGVVVLGLR